MRARLSARVGSGGTEQGEVGEENGARQGPFGKVRPPPRELLHKLLGGLTPPLEL